MSMEIFSSRANPKTLTAAVSEGVMQAIPEHGMASSVDLAIKRSKSELIDLMNMGVEADDPLLICRSFGAITAKLLTMPSIKIPNNKVETPEAIQIMRSVLATLVDPNHRLEIAVAFGGSEGPATLRTAPYIHPALETAEIFNKFGAPTPRVRIFNAHEVSSSINGLDANVAKKRADQTSRFMRAYVSHFAPTICPSVIVSDCSFDELRSLSHDEDSDMLLKLLRSEETTLSPEELLAQSAMKALLRSARKHSQSAVNIEETVAGYAAAHGLSFKNYGYSDVDSVIKIGGEGESKFDQIQFFMANRHHNLGRTVTNLNINGKPQPISRRNRAGLIPPYYREGAGEFSLDSDPDSLSEDINQLTQHYSASGLRSGSDFTFLPQHVAPGYLDFVKKHLGSEQGAV